MIGDSFHYRWKDKDLNKTTLPYITDWPQGVVIPIVHSVTKQEFDDLKKEVLIMKDLLIRALEYDKRNNEPHCEMEEKVALLKKVAEMVGVSLSDIFPAENTTISTK